MKDHNKNADKTIASAMDSSKDG